MQSGGTGCRGDWRVALVPVGAGVPAGAKHNRPAPEAGRYQNCVGAGHIQDAYRGQILFLFEIIFENPYRFCREVRDKP